MMICYLYELFASFLPLKLNKNMLAYKTNQKK